MSFDFASFSRFFCIFPWIKLFHFLKEGQIKKSEVFPSLIKKGIWALIKKGIRSHRDESRGGLNASVAIGWRSSFGTERNRSRSNAKRI